MSNKSDMIEEERRKRQIAIKRKLAELEAAASTPAQTISEAALTGVSPETVRAAATPMADSSRPVEHQPVRKPWQNSRGQQIRPMTRKEREQEDLATFDQKMMNDHLDFVRQSNALHVAEEQDRQKRQRKEKGQGLQPFANRDDHCSLEEAPKRGYFGSDGDTPDDNQNPRDNTRHDNTKFGR